MWVDQRDADAILSVRQGTPGRAMVAADLSWQRIESLMVRTNSGEVHVTASFGVAEYSARSGEGDKVFERADQALYAAKRNGRNRVETA